MVGRDRPFFVATLFAYLTYGFTASNVIIYVSLVVAQYAALLAVVCGAHWGLRYSRFSTLDDTALSMVVAVLHALVVAMALFVFGAFVVRISGHYGFDARRTVRAVGFGVAVLAAIAALAFW